MAFPTYRLPPDIEEGAQGGPEFATVIQESVSGQEQRVKVWAKCRARYDIAYSVLALGRSGRQLPGGPRAVLRAHRPPPSVSASRTGATTRRTMQCSGPATGSDTTFQLTKTYDPSQILLARRARSPTRARSICSRTAPVIKVNGVTQTLTTHYTIGATGLVTFVTPPTNGHALTWTGEFDIPVRFDTRPSAGHHEREQHRADQQHAAARSHRVGRACLMRDYNITLTSTTLFLARVVKITRLDGVVLRIAEAEESITASAQTFSPLPGAEISAVKHIINGDDGIDGDQVRPFGGRHARHGRTEHTASGTARRSRCIWSTGRALTDARRSDLHRPDRHGVDQSDRLVRLVRYSRPDRAGRGIHPDLSADVPDGSVQRAVQSERGGLGSCRHGRRPFSTGFNFTVAGLASAAGRWMVQPGHVRHRVAASRASSRTGYRAR